MLKKFVLVSALVMAVTVSASAGQTPAIRIAVGGTASSGLGEDPLSFFARLTGTADLGRVRLEAAPFYELSRKYTGHGYIVGVDGSVVAVIGRGLLLIGRLDGHRRNGGAFTKDVLLVGGGLGWESSGGSTTTQMRLTTVAETASRNSDNRIRQYQLGCRMYGPSGRIRLSMDIAGTFQTYRNSGGGSAARGFFLQAAVGVGF